MGASGGRDGDRSRGAPAPSGDHDADSHGDRDDHDADATHCLTRHHDDRRRVDRHGVCRRGDDDHVGTGPDAAHPASPEPDAETGGDLRTVVRGHMVRLVLLLWIDQ